MRVSRSRAFFISSALLLSLPSAAIGFPACETPEMRLLCNDTLRNQFDHCFITVACGKDVYACRGGPATGSGAGGRADLPVRSTQRPSLLFGLLRTGCRPYDTRNPDWLSGWKDDATPHARVDLLAKYPRETADCFKQVFELMDGCVAYDPLPESGKSNRAANSNSAVATALFRCGLGGLQFPATRAGGSRGDEAIIDLEAVPCGTKEQLANQRFRQTLEEVGSLYLKHKNKLFSRPELKPELDRAVAQGRARIAREEGEFLKNAVRLLPPPMTAPQPAETPAVTLAQQKQPSATADVNEKGAGRSGGGSKSPGGN